MSVKKQVPANRELMKKVRNIKKIQQKFGCQTKNKDSQKGFSLVEVITAMVVFLVVMLGLVNVFTYAVNYNVGNNARSQALAVMQQEVELYRSAKFTPHITDPKLTGGTKTPYPVNSADGNRFRIQTVVDDDPSTVAVDVNNLTTLKEITVTVTLENPTPGWQTAVPAKVVLRRARSN